MYPSDSRPFRLRAHALLPALVLVIATAAAAHADPLPIIDLTIHNARFHPQTLKVPTGRKFKLRVTNRGPGVEEFESTDLNRERIVPPGRSIEIYLGPLKPGRYKIFGDFHPATARGEIVAEGHK